MSGTQQCLSCADAGARLDRCCQDRWTGAVAAGPDCWLTAVLTTGVALFLCAGFLPLEFATYTRWSWALQVRWRQPSRRSGAAALLEQLPCTFQALLRNVATLCMHTVLAL